MIKGAVRVLYDMKKIVISRGVVYRCSKEQTKKKTKNNFILLLFYYINFYYICFAAKNNTYIIMIYVYKHNQIIRSY